MVINPIVGVYIPIIRIPIKGGMTIPNIATLDHGTFDPKRYSMFCVHPFWVKIALSSLHMNGSTILKSKCASLSWSVAVSGPNCFRPFKATLKSRQCLRSPRLCRDLPCKAGGWDGWNGAAIINELVAILLVEKICPKKTVDMLPCDSQGERFFGARDDIFSYWMRSWRTPESSKSQGRLAKKNPRFTILDQRIFNMFQPFHFNWFRCVHQQKTCLGVCQRSESYSW